MSVSDPVPVTTLNLYDPVAAVNTLADSRRPYLIGIRHHSPVLAAAIPRLLGTASPDLILLELPAELQEWLPWLGHPEMAPPVALAAARKDGRGLVFYPYADFSPELAAVRWAREHGVPVEAFDLPLGLSAGDTARSRTRLAPEAPAPLSEALSRAVRAQDADELWDRTIEVRAPGAEPEAIRRAALAVGWSLRFEQTTWGSVPASDLAREAWMRQRLHAALAVGAQRPVAVIGAFHATALLQPPEPVRKTPKLAEVVTSLVPYAFELLDSRTGYPAGIRDPGWQQHVWRGGAAPETIGRALNSVSVRVCRELRQHGHPAGVADAREAIRMATDLGRLRDLPAPGRRELVEALQTVLAHGEPHGRGRAVATAMERVLVGTRRGRLAPGTPRSGLGPHVEALLAELRLPGPAEAYPREIRLDPLRSDLDRRRHIAIQRLRVCDVPYAVPISVDADLLTGLWVLSWRPATAAALELSSHRGVTLAQAAEGTLRARLARSESAGGLTTGGSGAGRPRGQSGAGLTGAGITARLRLETLRLAAECALPDLVQTCAAELEGTLPHQATLHELVEGLELCDRLVRGHIPGLAPTPPLADLLTDRVAPALVAAAVAAIEGLAGSNSLEDAQALLAIAQRLAHGQPLAPGQPFAPGQPLERGKSEPIGQRGATARDEYDLRLRFALQAFERDGSPLMQGAAGAVQVLLGWQEPDAFGARMASWLDGADQSALARRLSGALAMAAPLLEAAPSLTDRLIERVSALADDAFLQRLPALREGFEVLSPAARERFLHALRPQLSAAFDVRLEHAPEALARWAAADLQARQAVLAVLPEALDRPPQTVPGEPSTSLAHTPQTVPGDQPSTLAQPPESALGDPPTRLAHPPGTAPGEPPTALEHES